jgi:hypothetical protein
MTSSISAAAVNAIVTNMCEQCVVTEAADERATVPDTSTETRQNPAVRSMELAADERAWSRSDQTRRRGTLVLQRGNWPASLAGLYHHPDDSAVQFAGDQPAALHGKREFGGPRVTLSKILHRKRHTSSC